MKTLALGLTGFTTLGIADYRYQDLLPDGWHVFHCLFLEPGQGNAGEVG
jgi:hypothetical protein